jgi:hypothetical protein
MTLGFRYNWGARRPSAEAAEAGKPSPTYSKGLSASGGPVSEFAAGKSRDGSDHVYATVRRYEGIGKVRSEEVMRSVGENVLPSRPAGCGAGGSAQKSLLQFARRPSLVGGPKRSFREAFHESAAAW